MEDIGFSKYILGLKHLALIAMGCRQIFDGEFSIATSRVSSGIANVFPAATSMIAEPCPRARGARGSILLPTLSSAADEERRPLSLEADTLAAPGVPADLKAFMLLDTA